MGGVVFHGIELRFQMDAVPLRDFFRLGNYYLRGGSLCLGGDALPGGRCAGGRGRGRAGVNYPRILICVAVMALVTYLPRVLPLAIFRKKINNRFVKSFLFYVPYAVLRCV